MICSYNLFLPQEDYFRRHPEGVNPVQLNDVVFSISSFISLCMWILQCGILKVNGVSSCAWEDGSSTKVTFVMLGTEQ